MTTWNEVEFYLQERIEGEIDGEEFIFRNPIAFQLYRREEDLVALLRPNERSRSGGPTADELSLREGVRMDPKKFGEVTTFINMAQVVRNCVTLDIPRNIEFYYQDWDGKIDVDLDQSADRGTVFNVVINFGKFEPDQDPSDSVMPGDFEGRFTFGKGAFCIE